MRKFDNINVIPFIDILLVLLAIVLTTATFVSNSQLDIELPTANTESEAIDVDKIEIAIDRDEDLYLDGNRIELDQLAAQLKLLSTDSHVVLSIDEVVEFQRFVTLIDLLKSLSLDSVSIVIRKGS